MRRILSLSVAVILLFISGVTVLADEPVTLTYLTWGWFEAEDEIIKRFEALHPHIKVEPVYVGDQRDAITVRLVGGADFDLFAMDAYFAQSFFEIGAALPLDDYIERDEFDLTNYLAPLVEENRGFSDGKMYGVDYGGYSGVWVAYYNQTMLDKSGIATPDISWTWEDFRDIARRVTRFDGAGVTEQWGVVGASMSHEAYWYPWVLGNGGGILNDDRTASIMHEPESTEIFQFLVDLVHEDRSHPSGADFARMAWGWHGNAFIQGNAAIMFDWDNFGHLQRHIGDQFEWAMMTVPGGPRGNVSVIKGNSLSIAAHSKHPDEAWEFLKFYASAEAQEILYTYGHKPWLISVRTDPRFTQWDVPPYDVGVAFHQSIDIFPFVPQWQDLADIWRAELYRAFSGDSPVEEVLGAISEQIDTLLKEN